MAARKPWIFIDHSAQPFGHLVIGTLPQGAERTCGAYDRQIIYVILCGDFRQLVRHASTAGDARNHAPGLFKNTVQYALGAAHFPQHVDVDCATTTRNFMCKANLRYTAANAVFDKFFMPFGACFAEENLRDHLAIFIIAVGIHCRNCANSAGCSPCARTCMICCGNALATFDQWPNFTATVHYGFQTFEHNCNP